MFARGRACLHTPPFLGQKFLAAKSPVSITSQLIQNKRLRCPPTPFFPALTKNRRGTLLECGGSTPLLRSQRHRLHDPWSTAHHLKGERPCSLPRWKAARPGRRALQDFFKTRNTGHKTPLHACRLEAGATSSRSPPATSSLYLPSSGHGTRVTGHVSLATSAKLDVSELPTGHG